MAEFSLIFLRFYIYVPLRILTNIFKVFKIQKGEIDIVFSIVTALYI